MNNLAKNDLPDLASQLAPRIGELEIGGRVIRRFPWNTFAPKWGSSLDGGRVSLIDRSQLQDHNYDAAALVTSVLIAAREAVTASNRVLLESGGKWARSYNIRATQELSFSANGWIETNVELVVERIHKT